MSTSEDKASATRSANDAEEQPPKATDGEETEQDDSLSAMRKRVAAIEAEAAKITAMSAAEPDEEELPGNASLTPPKSQSQDANKNSSNNGSHIASKAASADVDANANDQKEKTVDAPQHEDGEQYPSSIEEQEKIDQRSVFVKNIDANTDAKDLKGHFESCGTIERITICCDKYTGTPKGCAYIQFKSQESVAAACLLNDKEFQGKTIQVVEKRTNLPMWLRAKRGGRGGRGRGRGRGGWGYSGYRGRGSWGYGPYRGRGGYGGWGGGGYGYGYPY
mmetsp:Transcript_47606/g.76351  ORF Transcript_47606/g.76351 Transcript_47606/m.76351 type:complete len:277 (+) Transcript_47606:63-893(+)